MVGEQDFYPVQILFSEIIPYSVIRLEVLCTNTTAKGPNKSEV